MEGVHDKVAQGEQVSENTLLAAETGTLQRTRLALKGCRGGDSSSQWQYGDVPADVSGLPWSRDDR